MWTPLLLFLPLLASSPSPPAPLRSQACLDLLSYRLLEDELDIEAWLQWTTFPRDQLFDRLVTSLLLYCHDHVSDEFAQRVVAMNGTLSLTEPEEAFLHTSVGNWTSEEDLAVTEDERRQYRAIVAAGKAYRAGAPSKVGREVFAVVVLALLCTGLGVIVYTTPRMVGLRLKARLFPSDLTRKQT